MIRKCKSGKIDLILTKPISRFGRNTLDELRTLQDLRVLRVDVYFEQEKLRCYAIYIETDTESAEYRLKVIGTISEK
jgi:DNA invertase Pin-like site-specific DNA recombinase